MDPLLSTVTAQRHKTTHENLSANDAALKSAIEAEESARISADASIVAAGGGGGGGGMAPPYLQAVGRGVTLQLSAVASLDSDIGYGYALNPGTASGGQGTVLIPTARSVLLGAGRVVLSFRAKVPVLSNDTDAFISLAGLRNDSAGYGTDCVAIRYVHSESLNWSFYTRRSSTETRIDTGVLVTAGGVIDVRLEVNADGTEASCYFDNVLVGTITTNIPTGASNAPTICARSEYVSGSVSTAGLRVSSPSLYLY